jgi:hypothetical protein
MSTRGLIAKATGESRFEGRYHHSDSYPSGGLGEYLVELYSGHFQRDLDKMVDVLLVQHPAGWSTIVHKDFHLKPGWTLADLKTPGFDCSDAERKARWARYQAHPDYRRPQCYCHGHRSEEPQSFTETDDTDAIWAYVFDTLTDEKILHVLHREQHQHSGENFWNDVGRIELDSAEPVNWTEIECGADFSRCCHTASHHGFQSTLSTRTYLGLDPLDFRDSVAFIINGKRYENTGSGGDANFLNRSLYRRQQKPFPHDTWIATVKAANGRRLDVPVAILKGDKRVPLPGVTWVWPATKSNPRETLVSLKQAELYAAEA